MPPKAKKSSSKKPPAKSKSKSPTRVRAAAAAAPDVEGLANAFGNVNLGMNPDFTSIQGQYSSMATVTFTPFVANERKVFVDIHVVSIHERNFLLDVAPNGMSITLCVLVPPYFISRERIQAELNLPHDSRDVMLTAFNTVAQDASTFFSDGTREAPGHQVIQLPFQCDQGFERTMIFNPGDPDMCDELTRQLHPSPHQLMPVLRYTLTGTLRAGYAGTTHRHLVTQASFVNPTRHGFMGGGVGQMPIGMGGFGGMGGMPMAMAGGGMPMPGGGMPMGGGGPPMVGGIGGMPAYAMGGGMPGMGGMPMGGGMPGMGGNAMGGMGGGVPNAQQPNAAAQQQQAAAVAQQQQAAAAAVAQQQQAAAAAQQQQAAAQQQQAAAAAPQQQQAAAAAPQQLRQYPAAAQQQNAAAQQHAAAAPQQQQNPAVAAGVAAQLRANERRVRPRQGPQGP